MLVTTRMETTLSAEQWTSYMSHEGASLQFSCGSGARVLTVKACPGNTAVETYQTSSQRPDFTVRVISV